MSDYLNQFQKLDEVGTIARGKSKHRPRNEPSLYGGKYPFIQTGDVKHSNLYITEYSQTYNEKGLSQSKLWQAGTLCITIAANIADTAILKFPACFPDSIIGFIPYKNKADVRFIKYCLDTYKIQIQAISQGTTQDNLSVEKLLSLKFRIPLISIQKKIGAILSAYDDLIEKNNRRIAILEKMAEEIYREWFVRLRFPGHEQVKFNKGIPEGWERKRFDEFCLLQRGYDLPDAKVIPGQYPVIASTSIKTYHNQFKVNPPVITTGRSGSLGTVLFINSQAWPLNTTLFLKNFYGNSPYLIYYTLKFLKLENFNSGAGVPTLNRNHLGGLYMSVPPKNLQNNFTDKIAIIFKQKELLVRLNNKLVETRDRLLPRLISGKLSVENLDIQFPPSMADTPP
ncbi:restriction endonuclease subunit S [Anabaena sp. CA = ATCC 33047]|uniref:restriction endonuclease subunit S n=1 Tax=Anabaena sp. (strain CA / ATCC 33047) TaxID=52271 RepID=UPI00082EB2E7|nr:restriction endonuclease subunit S [Anabaena sp. CA = ATCC 33047]